MPAPRIKSHCKRGHDIAVVGRRPSGGCRGCARERQRTGMPTGRPRKEFCYQGHELTGENRYMLKGQPRGCRTCRAANLKRYKARKGIKPRDTSRVPSDPVLTFVAKIGLKEFCRLAGSMLHTKPGSVERMLWRAKETGQLTITAADDLCVALGRHPVEVFGPVWFTYGAEVADAV